MLAREIITFPTRSRSFWLECGGCVLKLPYLTEHFLLCTTIELYRLDEKIWEPEAEKGVEGGETSYIRGMNVSTTPVPLFLYAWDFGVILLPHPPVPSLATHPLYK